MDKTRADWLMTEVADAARAHILPRFRRLDAGEIREKTSAVDLVTEADLACEAALTEAINTHWPEALVVGEEAVAAAPALLDRIAEAETCVILDPVDGTWNFAHGMATFGVIVAVTRFGVPIWGGLYDPLLGDWVVGAEGAGAAFVAEDRTLPLRPGPAGARLEGYMPMYLFGPTLRPRIFEAMQGFGRVANLRCSCHEYRMLAQGHVDWVLSAELKPWDHAAGALVVAEAGGVARMLDGSAYSAARHTGCLLAARDQGTWDRVAETFGFLA